MSDSYNHLNKIEKKIKTLHTEKSLLNSRVKKIKKEVNLARNTRKQKEIRNYLDIADQRLDKIEVDLKDQKLLWERIYNTDILHKGMGLIRSPTKENEPKIPITTISDAIATNTDTNVTVSLGDRPIVSTGASSASVPQLGPFALAMQKRTEAGTATGGAIPKNSQKDTDTNLRRIDEESEADRTENLYSTLKKYSEFADEPNEYSNIFDQQNKNLKMKDSGTNLRKRPTELDLHKLSMSEGKKPKAFSFDGALNSSPIHKNNSNTFTTAVNDSVELRHLQLSKQSSGLHDNPNMDNSNRNRSQNPSREVHFERDFENVRNNPQHSVSMEPMNIGQNDFNETYTLNEPHVWQNNLNTNLENPRMIFLKRLNNIPEFDGETFDNLKKFVEKSETLFHSSVNDAERTELFEQILIKANGEARNVITSLDNPDWEMIKKALYSHYSHLCNKSLITTQLENLRQKKDESLTDYADRARKLLNTKNAMYTQINSDQRHEHNRIAYKAFMKGLSNTGLRERVATRGAASLENAIENAIDMDTDNQNQIPKSELYCRICRINGHREQDCRRKQSGNNSIATLVNALRNLGSVNFSRSQNFPYNRNMAQNRPFSRNPFRTYQYNNENNSRLPMTNRSWNPNINRFNNPNNYNNYNNGNNPNTENNANTQIENQQRQFPNRNQQNRNNSRQNQVNTVATDLSKQRQQPSTSASQEN